MFKLYCLSDTVAIIFYQTVDRGKAEVLFPSDFPQKTGNTVVDDA
jgi:hypothetical protein